MMGWLLEGKSTEARNRIIRALNGEDGPASGSVNDEAIAEAYREDGETELMIQMRQDMRRETDPMRKAEIRVKYMAMARAAREKLEAEAAEVKAAEDEAGADG
jgi:hypothetical protein